MRILEAIIEDDGDLRVPEEVWRTMGVKPADRVRVILDGRVVRLEVARSSLLAGFGAVRPRDEPEDFGAIRRDMEVQIGRSA